MSGLVKKKWFWPTVVVAGLIVVAVIGQALGLITPRDNTPPDGQTPTPSTATPSVTPESIPEATPVVMESETPSEEEQSIDFEACAEKAREELSDVEFFPYVKDISITAHENEGKIVFTAALDDATDPQVAQSYADTMIRRFHLMVTTWEDDSLRSPGNDNYGGLYDTYAIEIGVAPISATGDVSRWWVLQTIPAGSHRPIVSNN